MKERPLPDSIPPQVGAGGGTPRPRNARPDSARITKPTRVVNNTMMGGNTLGRMWRHRIQGVDAPIDCAACKYMLSRTDTTAGQVDPRAGNSEQQAERDDDLDHDGAKHGHYHDQDDEVGESLPGIDEALDDEVDLATDVASDDAEEHGDEGRKPRGAEADDDGKLRAVEAAREHVAAEVVGAEGISPRRRLQALYGVDLIHAIRRQRVGKDSTQQE